MFTALRKYVEDTCQAIKEVDIELQARGSGLAELLFEFPNRSSNDEATWRNLIGRRDVIAHQILTVDDQRVYDETKRDFHLLHQLLSRVFFTPVITDIANNLGFSPQIKRELFDGLTPMQAGETPQIGASLTFICDDQTLGFVAIRMGITKNNQLLFAASQPLSFPLSVAYLREAPPMT